MEVLRDLSPLEEYVMVNDKVAHHLPDILIDKTFQESSGIRINRFCQATISVSQTQSTCKEVGTQMAKKGVYISKANDSTLLARPVYQLSEMVEVLKIQKAVLIQRQIRMYLAKKKVEYLRFVKRTNAHKKECESILKQEALLERAELCERRLRCPQTLADIEHNQIEWAHLFRDTLTHLKLEKNPTSMKRYISAELRQHNMPRKRSYSVPKYVAKLWFINGEVMEVENEEDAMKYSLLSRILSESESIESRLDLNRLLREADFRPLPNDLDFLLTRERTQLLGRRPLGSMIGLRQRIYRAWLKFISDSTI